MSATGGSPRCRRGWAAPEEEELRAFRFRSPEASSLDRNLPGPCSIHRQRGVKVRRGGRNRSHPPIRSWRLRLQQLDGPGGGGGKGSSLPKRGTQGMMTRGTPETLVRQGLSSRWGWGAALNFFAQSSALWPSRSFLRRIGAMLDEEAHGTGIGMIAGDRRGSEAVIWRTSAASTSSAGVEQGFQLGAAHGRARPASGAGHVAERDGPVFFTISLFSAETAFTSALWRAAVRRPSGCRCPRRA